jgi:hypothetical protein
VRAHAFLLAGAMSGCGLVASLGDAYDAPGEGPDLDATAAPDTRRGDDEHKDGASPDTSPDAPAPNDSATPPAEASLRESGATDAAETDANPTCITPATCAPNIPCCAPLKCNGAGSCVATCIPAGTAGCTSNASCCSPLVCGETGICVTSCTAFNGQCAPGNSTCCFGFYCMPTGPTGACEACNVKGTTCLSADSCCGKFCDGTGHCT